MSRTMMVGPNSSAVRILLWFSLFFIKLNHVISSPTVAVSFTRGGKTHGVSPTSLGRDALPYGRDALPYGRLAL